MLNLSSIPQASPPTFLFLPYSIVKKQTHIRVKNHNQKPESPNPQEPNLSANPQVFSRTKDIVASSAAALVSERVIELHPRHSQQGGREKIQKNGKLLVLLMYFRFSPVWMVLRAKFGSYQ
jgi:hypothetical protein